MSKYRQIFEYSRPGYLKDLSVNRKCEQGLLTVWLQVLDGELVKSIELSGFEELADAISPILIADRVIISEELGTQKEFGSIRIECWADTDYSEFWCDSAAV
ncbi:hypothetical protein [Photobacterium nomapromontoriensis]|uniref:hypothetical protein n=1 Tax=Photobacterium nomapromontoriensis TaxID=2910237 RepID=UPI003D0E0082